MESQEKATEAEVGAIIFTLADVRKRPYSKNFLCETCPKKGDGFPWTSFQWYKANITYPELENLFLFWNGITWGEGRTPPRRLKQGTEKFMEMAGDIRRRNFEHITGVLKKHDS